MNKHKDNSKEIQTIQKMFSNVVYNDYKDSITNADLRSINLKK